MADEKNVETTNVETMEKENEHEQTPEFEETKAEEKIEQQLEKQNDTIENLEKQQQELNNRLLRTQADYDNFRRRTNEEKLAAAKYKAQSLAEELLPVLDNFERALQASEESEETKSLLDGMNMVYRQLIDAMAKANIEEIQAQGQPFDPELHQAVMQVEDKNVESNTVIEVLQKGYKLHDRVIRPAMVKVNQ